MLVRSITNKEYSEFAADDIMASKVALLQRAIEIARAHRRWDIENELYVYLDALLATTINIQTVLSHHTLPDTTPFLSMVFTYNNEMTGISNPRMVRSKFRFLDDFNVAVVVFIIHILYKCIPERCYSRCHESGLMEACNDNPHLFDFVVKIVFASILGIYNTSRVKASPKTRRFVLALINNGVNKRSWLHELCSVNGEMLLFITKEYFHEMIEQSPGIKQLFAYQYDWPAIRRRQVEACDIIRDQININMQRYSAAKDDHDDAPSYNVLFAHVKERLMSERATEDSIPRQRTYAVQIRNPIDYINNLFLAFSLTRYRADDAQMRSGYEYELADPLPRNSIPIKTRALMKQLMVAMTKYYKQVMGVRVLHILPLNWLLIFGVRLERLSQFRRLMYLKTTKLRDELPLLTAHEYAVLYTFFSVHAEIDIYFEYPYDIYKYARHMEASIRMLDLKEGDAFPEKTVGQTYACDNCTGIKNQVLHQSRRNSSKLHGQLSTTVKIDDFSRVFCGNRPTKPQWKQTHYEKFGFFPSGPVKKASETRKTRNGKIRKKNKKIMLQHTAHRCTLYRARILDAFGHDIVYNNIAYFLCYACTKLTPYENVNVYGTDHLCDDCMYYCSVAEKCITETCEYCKLTTHSKQLERRYAFYLFDDTEPILEKQKWRMMYFCKDHGQMAWMKQHRFTTKSIAMTGLQNKWYMRDKDNKVIEVGSTLYGKCRPAFVDNRLDDPRVSATADNEAEPDK